MHRDERRNKRIRKLEQRKRLLLDFGLKGGCVYARHRAKIAVSLGYMSNGNVSHYVRVNPSYKTRSRARYGKVYLPSKRDALRTDSFASQLDHDTDE